MTYSLCMILFTQCSTRLRARVRAIRGGYLQSTDVYRISESIYDKCATAFRIAMLYGMSLLR